MHAARLAGDDASPGVAQGYKTMFLQDGDGQMRDTHSVAAGLDYVGVSPILTGVPNLMPRASTALIVSEVTRRARNTALRFP